MAVKETPKSHKEQLLQIFGEAGVNVVDKTCEKSDLPRFVSHTRSTLGLHLEDIAGVTVLLVNADDNVDVYGTGLTFIFNPEGRLLTVEGWRG